MADFAENPQGHPQRHVESFEDPHYHDEEDIPPPVEDAEFRSAARRPAVGKPSRRIPPPPRRFLED